MPERKSDFVNVNGVRLHYLDWGGNGPALIFLPGMGCNAYIFDHLAPRFTDRFHVLALTRRGHGDSDHPESGYSVDIFVKDILGFMTELGIGKAVFAGHSLAGIELSHIGARFPERTLALIYLDAGYDYSKESFENMIQKNPIPSMQAPGQKDAYFTFEEYFTSMRNATPGLDAIWGEIIEDMCKHELAIEPDGKIVDKMTDGITQAVSEAMKNYAREDVEIKVPVLGIFGIHNVQYNIGSWMTEAQKSQVRDYFKKINDPWQEENIEAFKRHIPHAKITLIHEGHHYCFLKKEDAVYTAMNDFLQAIS